jgi:hypothetical protein
MKRCVGREEATVLIYGYMSDESERGVMPTRPTH